MYLKKNEDLKESKIRKKSIISRCKEKSRKIDVVLLTYSSDLVNTLKTNSAYTCIARVSILGGVVYYSN